MASIFNFFKSGGAYSKSSTGVVSSSTSSSSDSQSASNNNNTNDSTITNNSENKSVNVLGEPQQYDTEMKTSSTSSKIMDGKNMIMSIQPTERPIFNKTDLEELMKLKEHLQYKPSVLNLVAVYQAEIQKHIEFGVKKNQKKVLNYQIEPAPTSNIKYIYVSSSGMPEVYCTNSDMIDYSHFQAIREGKSIAHSFDLQDLSKIEEVLKNQTNVSGASSISKQRLELEELELKYMKLMQQKERVLIDRASVLSVEELSVLEEEEGKSVRANQGDNEWEIERKMRIIENEKKLIEKRLVEAKKHKNIRFYCKGEFDYLTKWNDHFTKTNSETTPKGLDQLMRYRLTPTNVFDLGAEEIHFRFCESQLHRLGHTYGTSYPTAKIIKVDYIVNPVIMKRFNACKHELAKQHGFLIESMKPLLLFHGTSEANMENIVKTNFLLNKIGSTTDMGFYGKGFYFSEYPSMSMAYARNQFLLICMVLIGKAFKMDQVETGRAIEPGYDSHVSPDGCSEVIIFNPDQVIPLYKIEWANQ